MFRLATVVLALMFAFGCSTHRDRAAAAPEPGGLAELVVGSWTTGRGFVPVVQTFGAGGVYEESVGSRVVAKGEWVLSGRTLRWTTEHGQRSVEIRGIDATGITIALDEEPAFAHGAWGVRTQILKPAPAAARCG